MRTMKNYLRLIIIAIPIIVLAVIIFSKIGLLPRVDKDQTFHSPVFSRGGDEIYYLERTSSGISWGPGIEFFTPPARVIIFSDRFDLRVIDIKTKKTRTIYSWKIPHKMKSRKRYRNRLFGVPRTELVYDKKLLKYKIGLDVYPDDTPNQRIYEWSVGHWDVNSKAMTGSKQWERAPIIADPWPEDILHGNFEVINFKNRAILLYDSNEDRLTVLLVSNASKEITIEQLDYFKPEEYSHRKNIERVKHLKETRLSIYRKLKDEGLSEGDALLRTSDEMEKMGLYPKSPKITAKLVKHPDTKYTVFKITEMEFRVGLFQDIEQAIKTPGKEIRFWGNYVRHRDFDNSTKINSYLKDGHNSFYVTTDKKTYLISINR